MILYRHAPNKAALLDGVAEIVLAQLKVDPADPDWASQVRAIARDYRRLALAHPHVVPLLVTRPLATPLALRPPGTLRPLEDVLTLLTRAGFSGADALHIYRALFGFLHGHVLNELQELVENPEETDDLLRLGLVRCATVHEKPGAFRRGLRAAPPSRLAPTDPAGPAASERVALVRSRTDPVTDGAGVTDEAAGTILRSGPGQLAAAPTEALGSSAVSGLAISSRPLRSALTPRNTSASPARIISEAPVTNAITVSMTLPVPTSEENSSGPLIPPAAVPIAAEQVAHRDHGEVASPDWYSRAKNTARIWAYPNVIAL